MAIRAQRPQGRFDDKENGAARNAFNPAFLHQQIEIAAGIGAINSCQPANLFGVEASMTPQHAILRRSLPL